jgi:hypothetical protein
MRITQLQLKNVGPFDDATFEFPEPAPGSRGELVFFEGPNGCGKTTLIEAIAWLLALRMPNFQSPSLERRFRELQSFEDEIIAELQIHVGGTQGSARAHRQRSAHNDERSPSLDKIIGRLELAAGNRNPPPLSWAVYSARPHQHAPLLQTEGPRELVGPPLHGCLSFGDRRIREAGMDPVLTFGQLLTNLEWERVRSSTYAQERPAEAAKLEATATASGRAIRNISRALSTAIDREVRILFPSERSQPAITFDEEPIPIENLGEGMRSTFSWMAELLWRLQLTPWQDQTRSPLEQDFWLLLDEIDESLHPTAQARLYPMLRQLFPNARIYATTHSPFVVASVSEGTVFQIRPDRKTRHVSGRVESRPLTPGQSLEYVVSEIFEAHAGFVDAGTRRDLADHKEDVRKLRLHREIDWEAFLARRKRLYALNEEVRTVVAMHEVPVRDKVTAKLRVAEGDK